MHSWFAWNADWGWGGILVVLTITFQAMGIIGIARLLVRLTRGRGEEHPVLQSFWGAIAVLAAISFLLAVLNLFECVLWAIAYVALGAIPSHADALYFSVDSMTTRGASGLALAHQWQMLGAIEAANGSILFGLSTAFLIAMVSRVLPHMARRNIT